LGRDLTNGKKVPSPIRERVRVRELFPRGQGHGGQRIFPLPLGRELG